METQTSGGKPEDLLVSHFDERDNLQDQHHPRRVHIRTQLATPGGQGCLIYQWPLNRDHLAHGLFPAAAQIPAQPQDTVDEVLRPIPPSAEAFLGSSWNRVGEIADF